MAANNTQKGKLVLVVAALAGNDYMNDYKNNPKIYLERAVQNMRVT